MITTIYNILMLIFSSLIITYSTTNTVSLWYAVLCIGAVFISMRINNMVKLYPKVTSKYKEGLKVIFVEEYKTRLYNYITFYILHVVLLLTMTTNLSLVCAITGVVILRTMLLVQGYKKIKD